LGNIIICQSIWEGIVKKMVLLFGFIFVTSKVSALEYEDAIRKILSNNGKVSVAVVVSDVRLPEAGESKFLRKAVEDDVMNSIYKGFLDNFSVDEARILSAERFGVFVGGDQIPLLSVTPKATEYNSITDPNPKANKIDWAAKRKEAKNEESQYLFYSMEAKEKGESPVSFDKWRQQKGPNKPTE